MIMTFKIRDQRFIKKLLRGIFIIGISLVISFLVSKTLPFKKLEYLFLDYLLKTGAEESGRKNWDVVIIDISDQAAEEIRQQWPWSRDIYSKLIDNLQKAGVKTIGFDIMFDSETERDAAFKKAIEKSDNVVLAAKLSGGKRESATIIVPNASLFPENGIYGYINVWEGKDGVIRHYVPRVRRAGEYILSFASALYSKTFDKKGPSRPFIIDYYGPAKTFSYYSFELIIDDSTFTTGMEEVFEEDVNSFDKEILPSQVLRDKIVIVGASMAELGDIKRTPLDNASPGVEIHATALQAMIDNRYVSYAHPFGYFILTVILIAITLLISFRFKIITSSIAIFLLLIVFVIGAGVAFAYYHIAFEIVQTVSNVFCAYSGSIIFLFIEEQKDRRMITGMFTHYLPPSVVNELVKNPQKLKLGGERRELTVIFSDLEGFTTISESLTPEELVSLLNEYLTEMTGIIIKNSGIIDKYEGDLIMAEFGIPLELPDHAVKACQSALQMQKRLTAIRNNWIKLGKPAIKARVGIGSGPMAFGNMGSKQTFDYTVMGDVVNLASRLEGANKTYGTYLMINERTNELVKDVMITREMDLLRVKGKTKPERCFHLLGEKSNPDSKTLQSVADIFTEGIMFYRQQQWSNAIKQFKKVFEIYENDAPSKLYIERCKKFKKIVPGDKWDGVFTMTTK